VVGEDGEYAWRLPHEVALAYQAGVKEDGYAETWAFLRVEAHAGLEAADDAEDVDAGVEEFVGA
jgi:hypothetical protein